MNFDFDWKVYAALALVLLLMALPVLHRRFYGKLPAVDASRLVNDPANFRLIDLRAEKAFKAAHIERAINLPCSRIKPCSQAILQMMDEASQTPTVLICDTDLVSTRVAKQLIDTGADNVFILKGGFNYWKRKRLPLVTA